MDKVSGEYFYLLFLPLLTTIISIDISPRAHKSVCIERLSILGTEKKFSLTKKKETCARCSKKMSEDEKISSSSYCKKCRAAFSRESYWRRRLEEEPEAAASRQRLHELRAFDPPGTRTCARCLQRHDIETGYRKSRGYKGPCKECINAAQQKLYVERNTYGTARSKIPKLRKRRRLPPPMPKKKEDGTHELPPDAVAALDGLFKKGSVQ